MAVLAMVFSGAILVMCVVIVVQRLGRRSPERRGVGTAEGGSDGLGWFPATATEGRSECGGADAGGGCDGGGGGD